jgi:hypothetical protein
MKILKDNLSMERSGFNLKPQDRRADAHPAQIINRHKKVSLGVRVYQSSQARTSHTDNVPEPKVNAAMSRLDKPDKKGVFKGLFKAKSGRKNEPKKKGAAKPAPALTSEEKREVEIITASYQRKMDAHKRMVLWSG